MLKNISPLLLCEIRKKLLIFSEVYVKMSLLLQDKVLHTMPR